jgi:myo-inositol 2-dehydrogenase/D-chiro-inositol 1-dehydrogenase
MRRFDPSYTAMKSALGQGKIGQAIMFHCFHRNVEAPANFTGQMAISNSAPHEFDAARFMLNEEIARISVFQPQRVDTSKVGAPVFMVLETSSGRLVNVEIIITASPEAYAAFLARLDMPPQPNERLRKTMQTAAPWEKT